VIYGVVILLVLFRIVPIVLVVPFLAGPSLSVWVRVAIVVAVAGLVFPAALAGAPEVWNGDWLALSTLAMKELVVGTAIAVVASVVFWGVEMAGSVAEGLRGAPVRRLGISGRSTALGTFGLLLTVAVYFAVGGHLAFFAALVQSYEAVPLFVAPSPGVGESLILSTALLAGELFVVAALLALPAMAAVWLTDLALGTFQRMTPRWHAMLLGMPVRSLVVLVAFLFSLHVFVDVAIDGSLSWLGDLPARLGGGQ
jgi:flagellar biosynthetic protein FliR